MAVWALIVKIGCVHLTTHLSFFPVQKKILCQSLIKHCDIREYYIRKESLDCFSFNPEWSLHQSISHEQCNAVICSTLSSNIVDMTFQAWWLNNWCLQLCFPFSKHINLAFRKHINLIFRKHIILNFITNKLEVDTLWTTHILASVYSDLKICHSFLRCPESLINVSPLPCIVYQP